MRKIALITVAGLLGAAAPAIALTTTTATPRKAGQPSTLHFDIDGVAPPVSGRLPESLTVSAPGFRVSLNAIAKRCSEESAKLNECPAGSRIGSGSLVVAVTASGKVRIVTIPLSVYLHSNKSILTIAKVFGWQVVPATLDTRHGLVVRFDPLPAGPPFPGVSYALNRITLNFGATRVVKRHGPIAKARRIGLLRNPLSCRGSWPVTVTLGFRDATVAPIATSTMCSKS